MLWRARTSGCPAAMARESVPLDSTSQLRRRRFAPGPEIAVRRPRPTRPWSSCRTGLCHRGLGCNLHLHCMYNQYSAWLGRFLRAKQHCLYESIALCLHGSCLVTVLFLLSEDTRSCLLFRALWKRPTMATARQACSDESICFGILSNCSDEKSVRCTRETECQEVDAGGLAP